MPQVEDLRYVPQHRLESWGVPLKLPLDMVSKASKAEADESVCAA